MSKLTTLIMAGALSAVAAVPVMAADGPATTPAQRHERAAEHRKDMHERHHDRVEKRADRREERAEQRKERHEACKAEPQACREKAEQRAKEHFGQMDKDKSGGISKAEAEKGMPGLARHFDEVDTNKDGQVTHEEMRAAAKAHHEKRMEERQARQGERGKS